MRHSEQLLQNTKKDATMYDALRKGPCMTNLQNGPSLAGVGTGST